MIQATSKFFKDNISSFLRATTLLMICASIPHTVVSQVYQEEITVVAPYEPTISDAVKINLSPQTMDTVSLRKSFTYNILPSLHPTSFEFTLLKPARLSGEPLTKLYSNYIRAGMGTYTSPFLDYYYQSQRAKDLNYGVRLKHFSSHGDIPDVAYPGMSHNLIGFNLRHIGKKGLSKFADLSYERDVIHYYGFTLPDGITLHVPDQDYRQRYQQVNLDLGLFRHDSDKKKLFYDTRINLNHFSNLNKSKELHAGFSGILKNNFSFFEFSDIQELTVLGEAAVINTVLADSSLGTASLITIQPSFRTRLGEFDLHAGIRADVMTDTATDMHLSPVLGVKIAVLDHALSISFGLDGDVERNSLRSLSSENPFVADNLSMRFRINKLRVYGGIDGRLGRQIGFSTSLAIGQVENAGFFVADTLIKPWNIFTVQYDNMNLFEVKTAFTFDHSSKWHSKLRLHYQKYSLGDIIPWHTPELSGSYLLSYNLKEKFKVKAEVFGGTERYTRIFDQDGMESKKLLGPYIDLNAGVEYRYSKLLSGFIEFNNILNRQYEIWGGYPVQGLRFMAGITYAL